MKKDTRLELLNKNVRKSNLLIQKSRFKLSLQQQRIILYLIAQIEPWHDDFQTYRFNLQEFASVCGIELGGGRDYTELKDQVQAIADRSMWLTIEDGTKETLVRWIEEPEINHNSGTIELKINRHLKPYLLQLKEKYTEYQLIYTLHFRSKYTIRLYEIVCSVHFDKFKPYTKTYSLEELKRRLDCENYKDYRDFRRDILEKAINEINRYSDKNVSFEPITIGRRVVEIRLTVSSKDTLECLKIGAEIEQELGIVPGQLRLENA